MSKYVRNIGVKIVGSGIGFIDRTGEEHVTNEGYVARIVKYFNSDKCTIQLNDKHLTVLNNVSYRTLKKGEVKNPNKICVYGVGRIGVGQYGSVKGKLGFEAYSCWRSMLRRCYCDTKQKTYIDCEVCDDWKNFQNFAKWFYINRKYDHHKLDKDILVKGNRIYSPKTCSFVPNMINSFFVKPTKKREVGGVILPTGISVNGSNFAVYVSKYTIDAGIILSKNTHIGCYAKLDEAKEMYRKTKQKQLKVITNFFRNELSNELYDHLMAYEVID
jgi:hypothetical protein